MTEMPCLVQISLSPAKWFVFLQSKIASLLERAIIFFSRDFTMTLFIVNIFFVYIEYLKVSCICFVCFRMKMKFISNGLRRTCCPGNWNGFSLQPLFKISQSFHCKKPRLFCPKVASFHFKFRINNIMRYTFNEWIVKRTDERTRRRKKKRLHRLWASSVSKWVCRIVISVSVAADAVVVVFFSFFYINQAQPKILVHIRNKWTDFYTSANVGPWWDFVLIHQDSAT